MGSPGRSAVEHQQVQSRSTWGARGEHGKEKAGERKMRFLQNLVSYWLNRALTDTLANSRGFQRLAIRMDQFLSEFKPSEFTKAFREEMTKSFREEQMRNK